MMLWKRRRNHNVVRMIFEQMIGQKGGKQREEKGVSDIRDHI